MTGIPLTWINEPPSCVRIGVTAENQDVLDVRMGWLNRYWHGKNFVSVEPMLSQIQFRQSWIDYLEGWYTETQLDGNGDPEPVQAQMPTIDWVICGCESGSNARSCDFEWVRNLRCQCDSTGTPFFLKQLVIDGKLTKEPYLDGRQWLQFPVEEK
jgi:protein gp37